VKKTCKDTTETKVGTALLNEDGMDVTGKTSRRFGGK
jgi:hypothetical protein